MSVLADFQYTLSDFNEIKNTCEIYELDNLTIKNINKISLKVGAPNYIKTPIFKKGRGIKKKDDWNVCKNFKKTELHKNETGIEVEFDKVRMFLNKLTKKNYEEQSENIIRIIKNIESDNDKYLEKICKSIFEIGSKNKFWCQLYACLFKDLIKEFPYMKNICLSNFKNYMDIFNTINYVESNVDYNLFCEYNKENEDRKSLSKFFVLCSNYDIIERNEIINIIINFILKIEDLIIQENKVNHVDEIVQNLKIIIENFDSSYKNLDKYLVIKNKISYLSELNVKNYTSFTNKILFNLFDIQDIL